MPDPTTPLVSLDLPSPSALRGGWAAFAAVLAARGWGDDACATRDEWRFHDGGGNWACMRFVGDGRAVLFGHDHEYSDTYYGEAAAYFGEAETDLLAGAPAWWEPGPLPDGLGPWVGFIYGWEGHTWRRAAYEPSDGFTSIGLLRACSVEDTALLAEYAQDAPGLDGPPAPAALRALVDADTKIDEALLEVVVPGWDLAAGVRAGRQFLLNGTGSAGGDRSPLSP